MDLPVGGHRALQRHARGLRVDQQEDDLLIGGVGRHHDALRQVRLGHGQLGAVEHPTVAHRGGGDGRDAVHAHGHPVQGGGEHDVAGHHAGQPARLQLGRAELGQGNAPSTKVAHRGTGATTLP